MHEDPKDLRIIPRVAHSIILVPAVILLFVFLFSAYSYLLSPAANADIHFDPFIPELYCRDFTVGDAIDQFNPCFGFFFGKGELSPSFYPPEKMYQPYTIKKLPASSTFSNFPK